MTFNYTHDEFEPGSAQYPTLIFFWPAFIKVFKSDEQKNIKRKNEHEIKIDIQNQPKCTKIHKSNVLFANNVGAEKEVEVSKEAAKYSSSYKGHKNFAKSSPNFWPYVM